MSVAKEMRELLEGSELTEWQTEKVFDSLDEALKYLRKFKGDDFSEFKLTLGHSYYSKQPDPHARGAGSYVPPAPYKWVLHYSR